jgi:hypothetical protein
VQIVDSRILLLLSAPKLRKNQNMYAGVSLKDLIPDLMGRRIEIFQDSTFREKEVASSADLDLHSDIIVADTIDGKRLRKDHPFCFIAKSARWDWVLVNKMTYIRVAGTP